MNKFLLSSILLLSINFNNLLASSNEAKHLTFVRPDGLQATDYAAKTILFKVDEDYRVLCSENNINESEILNAMSKLGINELKLLFPHCEKPIVKYNKLGQQYADLTLTYQLVYTNDIDIVDAINILLATNKLEYAEPKFVHKLHLTPNDPNLTNQNAWLTKINAYNAWNISTGDTNVVIGIIDSGTDIDHPDLVANLKINYTELVNGIDDDNDGYIDNYRGWDVSENDNNANVDNSDHGSHVSGCAAAATNNATGVASPGFNCKFLPVKCAKQTSTNNIDNGYEGIVYAANHGCNIINCSWGGGFSGQTGQDAVTYATVNKNALVLASAGNDNADLISFPAGYQYVTSVAATNNSDIRASFSTYNYSVDVSAPGNNIYSTVYNNAYGNKSGTSMSSPIAAGAAALIKSVYPNYSALQVGEQLRVTCSNIYNISFNALYINKLGKGRINMANSLTQSLPSVRMEPINITDGNDNAFVALDTLKISGTFLNYLAPTINCNVVLSAQTNGQYVTIINPNFNIGALNTLASIPNTTAPFKVLINANTPANTKILFKLTYNDGTTYDDFQGFEVIANVDYINVHINDVATTITSKGRIFYNAESPTQGLGFAYKDTALAYEAGLIIGISNSQLVNNVRGTGTAHSADFQSMNAVQRNTTNPISDFDLFGRFNDIIAPTTNALGIEVAHKSFAWNQVGHTKYVIVEYVIKNTSSTSFSNLFAGIFADWDIQNYAINKSDQNTSIKLGYAYSNNSSKLFAGVKVLTSAPFNMYAADNIAGGGGGIDLSNGFDIGEKYQTLSSSRPQAGVGAGVDVINIVSTGPYNVNAGDSVRVAFALIGGDDLLDLETSANNAQSKYDAIYAGINSLNTLKESINSFPNPSSGNVRFNFNIEKAGNVHLKIYDATGKIVIEPINSFFNQGDFNFDINLNQLSSGLYTYTLTTQSGIIANKIGIKK